MGLKLDFQKYTLDFKFKAGTSRGILSSRDIWIIKLWDEASPQVYGLGESGPLKGLSIDDRPDLEDQIIDLKNKIGYHSIPQKEEKDGLVEILVREEFPSLRFALETALLDLINGGKRIIFDNPFSRSEAEIPINGLVWMGDKDFMLSQIDAKIEAGYDCLKMKIGAINFEQELGVLSYIRQHFKGSELILRVDANGAFSPDEALEKLKKLSDFDLHSIEQPIKPGQREEMGMLCMDSPVPIALDEELIGISESSKRRSLLSGINPQYIILKPTLLGGMKSSLDWIEIADKAGVSWWFTSALESNIGLNAISQLTGQFNLNDHQGLGTGQLYHNNFSSPLNIKLGRLRCDPSNSWNFNSLQLVR
ncbi:MAG: o-succinylbenzoate synthase [Bacteroidetes bacterium]|nr:o-succinylbenzoate synthase [Bacteroidota bacterium]